MSRGVLDFAGGTVVHINAGISAVVAATVLGVRKDYGRQAILPHNVPFVLLGAGLLWFGWFGFNGGSALAANELASLAFANTALAPMATLVVWVLLDYFRSGHATAVGAATAIVVGLVAITPAAGFVSPAAALALGAIAALPSYLVIMARSRTRLDDSLDVFAGHGVGGITGALLTGVFASKAWNAAGNDGLLAGNPAQLATQALGVGAAIVYSAIATFALLKVLGFVTALRAAPKAEGSGMDVTQHGEEAYASGEGSILVISEPTPGLAPAPVLNPQTAAR
jgi:Amt family ammonium transporter